MKLRIGILGCRGIPNTYGGFEQFAEQLSVALVQRGYEVFVYNSSLHPFKKNQWQGVHIIHCKDWEDRLDAMGQFVYDFNCIMDARKRSYDILLQLGYTSSSIWHWLWPRNAVTIVNMDGLEWKRTQYSTPARTFIKKAEAMAARHADHMVADSPGIQQYILNTYQKEPAFIPYAAEVFRQPDVSVLNSFQLQPYGYCIAVSRLEPENNIEMIIEGYLNSQQPHELIIIGSLNKYGKLWKKRYRGKKIRFIGAVYDKKVLNNLRYFSKYYFHGHSVGGTNPSLLEAMACNCSIVAHNNIFNKAVLGDDADYFLSEEEMSSTLQQALTEARSLQRKKNNINKIETIYNPTKIANAYENLMFECLKKSYSPGLVKASFYNRSLAQDL